MWPCHKKKKGSTNFEVLESSRWSCPDKYIIPSGPLPALLASWVNSGREMRPQGVRMTSRMNFPHFMDSLAGVSLTNVLIWNSFMRSSRRHHVCYGWSTHVEWGLRRRGRCSDASSAIYRISVNEERRRRRMPPCHVWKPSVSRGGRGISKDNRFFFGWKAFLYFSWCGWRHKDQEYYFCTSFLFCFKGLILSVHFVVFMWVLKQ